MAIFLTILKIIGIVLLCIIGLVLVIILYVLLTPFWFRVDGFIDREFNYNIKVKATTFLHFIQVHINLKKDEPLVFDGTIFGTLVKVFPKEDKKKGADAVEESDDTPDTIEDKAEDTAEEKTEETTESTTEAVKADEAEKSEAQPASDIDIQTVEADAISEEEEKPSVWDKIKSFLHKINPKNWGETIRNKIYEIKKKVEDTIADLKKKKEKVFEIINNPDNKEWFKKIFAQLKKLIKSLGLNMRGTNLDFCAGSPDTTGQICGVMALFPPIYDKKVKILPDFNDDNFYLDGNLTIKGRIQLICVVYFVLAIYLDANTQKIIKSLK